MEGYGLSKRGGANVEAIWPRISSAVAEREQTIDPSIDLGTSENWLIRDELVEFYKKAVQENLGPAHLSYPNGFNGDQDLLKALVKFFNTQFKPCIPVLKEHLSTAPGAAFALDALLYNICEPGDGLLVPTPCWNGFDWLLNVKAGVQPVFVDTACFADLLTTNLIPVLEKALSSSTRPIKGVLFTNPHNPFGQCYPKEVILEVIMFCSKHNIHFISDEIYGLSKFDNPDISDAVPFVSAMQLDVKAQGGDISRIHTIWSMSKDLGSSGLRMGCTVTQSNKPLATGLALASNTQMSSLTAIASSALLGSAELDRLILLNSERLSQAYQRMTAFLKDYEIQYIPAYMGPFLFARIVDNATSWEDEATTIQAFKEAGVSVSAGRSYRVIENEKGWARLNFAIPSEQLDEAINRLSTVLTKMRAGK